MIETRPEFLALLKAASQVKMTAAQIREQRISFVHGQSGVNKDRVREILYGE